MANRKQSKTTASIPARAPQLPPPPQRPIAPIAQTTSPPSAQAAEDPAAADLLAELKLAQEECRQLDAEYATLCAQHDEAEEAKEAIRRENAALEAELGIGADEPVEVFLREREHYLEVLKGDIEDLKRQIAEAKTTGDNIRREIEEARGTIRSTARVRCMLPGEVAASKPKVPFEIDRYCTTIKYDARKKDRTIEPQSFVFDRVFTEDETNDAVYEEVRHLVQSATEGFRVCIFTSGATGSGKTHTMEGPSFYSPKRGILPRAVQQIFDGVGERRVAEVTMSCLEVYLNNPVDLLLKGPKRKLEFKNTATTIESEMPELTRLSVRTVGEAAAALKRAKAKRNVAETKSNAHSSRGHVIYTFLLRLADGVQGVLRLIDLAGNEDTTKSEVGGVRMKEASDINTSLTCLKRMMEVIRSGTAAHVPKRDHLLTQVLWSSMVGHCKTLTVVAISPTQDDVDFTTRSLEFGQAMRACSVQAPAASSASRAASSR